MSVRADLRADRHRCRRCFRLLAAAQFQRVVYDSGHVDVVILCGCGQPTIIAWVRDD